MFEFDAAIFEFMLEFMLLFIMEFEFARIALALFEVLVAGDPHPAKAAAETVTVNKIENFLYITCLPKSKLLNIRVQRLQPIVSKTIGAYA